MSNSESIVAEPKPIINEPTPPEIEWAMFAEPQINGVINSGHTMTLAVTSRSDQNDVYMLHFDGFPNVIWVNFDRQNDADPQNREVVALMTSLQIRLLARRRTHEVRNRHDVNSVPRKLECTSSFYRESYADGAGITLTYEFLDASQMPIVKEAVAGPKGWIICPHRAGNTGYYTQYLDEFADPLIKGVAFVRVTCWPFGYNHC